MLLICAKFAFSCPIAVFELYPPFGQYVLVAFFI
nr:MAG TPA: hypothetical protein [Caudoviricetes sp.]